MEFLKKLIATPGVAGREERIRELILAEAAGLFDETTVDPMGNLICHKKPGKRSGKTAHKVMIAAHMDEIGFYVRAIDEEGRLRLQKVGGFEPRNLFARRVLVQGQRDLVGVMNPGIRPIHVASEEDRKKVVEVKDFFVDLFLPAKEVQKLVRVGDPVTWIQDLEVIGDVWTGKAMDDRIAIWVAINALRKAAERSPHDIYFVGTVQEEVGCRGAGPGAYGIDADIAIAVDITLSCDTPGIEKTDAISELGKGCALKVMDSYSISDRGLLDEFIATARQRKIPHQLEILPLGGTDAGSMQRAGAGCKAFTLSIPTRYVHTPTESVHRKDVQAGVDLLAAWLTK
ncbi:MAG: M42 family metallopeptidase [Phycisphaerae bacterium]|nr:M42 family metallopeptidase [Phycisphaerae bacterium]